MYHNLKTHAYKRDSEYYGSDTGKIKFIQLFIIHCNLNN